MDDTPTMNYEEARELIKDGDLMSFKPNDNNPLHKLTLKVTKSEYYHTAVAVWMQAAGGTARLFVVEAHRGGRRLVPASLYATNSFDVIQCPVEFENMEASLLEHVGDVKYSIADFVAVGARLVFGLQLKDQDGEICSEMAQKEYIKAGLNMPSYLLSPGELHSVLVDFMKVPERVHVTV